MKSLPYASENRTRVRFGVQRLESVDKIETVHAPAVDLLGSTEITQVFLIRPAETKWFGGFSRNLVRQIVEQAKDMQIVIVADPDSMVRRGGVESALRLHG